jgi:hypothetical protein
MTVANVTTPAAGSSTPATGTSTPAPRSVRRKQFGVPAPTRLKPADKYQALLQGLAKYKSAPGFPVEVFADGTIEASLGSYVQDATTIAASRAQLKAASGNAMAKRSQGEALLDRGIALLIGFYGPASDTLVDFGISPKRPRRRRKVTPAAAAPDAGSASGSVGDASGTGAATPTGPPVVGGSPVAPVAPAGTTTAAGSPLSTSSPAPAPGPSGGAMSGSPAGGGTSVTPPSTPPAG